MERGSELGEISGEQVDLVSFEGDNSTHLAIPQTEESKNDIQYPKANIETESDIARDTKKKLKAKNGKKKRGKRKLNELTSFQADTIQSSVNNKGNVERSKKRDNLPIVTNPLFKFIRIIM